MNDVLMEGFVIQTSSPRGSRFIVECRDGTFAGFRLLLGHQMPRVGHRITWARQDEAVRMLVHDASMRAQLHVDCAQFRLSNYTAEAYLLFFPQ